VRVPALVRPPEAAVSVGGDTCEQAREPGLAAQERLRLALEQVAPFLGDGAGVVEVLLEEQSCVARVQAVDVGTSHVLFRCSRGGAVTRARGS